VTAGIIIAAQQPEQHEIGHPYRHADLDRNVKRQRHDDLDHRDERRRHQGGHEEELQRKSTAALDRHEVELEAEQVHKVRDDHTGEERDDRDDVGLQFAQFDPPHLDAAHAALVHSVSGSIGRGPALAHDLSCDLSD
jgi:hypothetical protein